MPIPLIPLAVAAYGAISSGIASRKRKKAEQELERQAAAHQPNASIIDYYNKSLAKFNVNPYQSASYTQQNNQIQRNLATGLNSAQNRRLGLGAIGGLVQQANDASARAVGNSESQSARELAMLGSAAGAKTNEQQRKFDMMYNLQAAKAGAYASTQNSGLQNLYSGLSTAAYMYGMGNDNNEEKNPWDNGYNAGANAWRMPRSKVTF